MNSIKPNTFLIGIQKAGTTSFYDWISQHPEICAPASMKDFPFFLDERIYSQGFQVLDKTYQKHWDKEPIIVHGNVNYIFFEKALANIKEYNPSAKFLLVLRNPLDRALSAYNYSVQRGLENRSFEEAVEDESKIYQKGSLQEKCDLTYLLHGNYHEQLKMFLKYFDKNQLKVLFFEDIKNEPEMAMKETFKFLGVDDKFTPKFEIQNETGIPRSKVAMKLLYGESKSKKWFMEKIFNKFFSLDTKLKLKNSFAKLFLKPKKPKSNPNSLNKEKYKLYYASEIEKLEKLLQTDLSEWK